MPSLYEHLNARMGDDEPAGITPLDLTDLPQEQKHVMLSLLRDSAGTTDGLTTEGLRRKLEDRVQNLDATISELSRLGWLIVMGESPNLRYRVNLRAKRGRAANVGLWAALSDRLSKEV